jgi:hypothetical protein
MHSDSPDLEQAIEQFLEERRSGSGVDSKSFARRFPDLGVELVEAL